MPDTGHVKERAENVVIVGAGAAGIAAARMLTARGQNCHVLEARSLIGGRAWTHIAEGYPLDMGCGWLHSADKNPWTSLAKDLGFTIDRTKPLWERQSCNQGMSPGDQKALSRAYEDFNKKIRAHKGDDTAAVNLLTPGERWNALLNAISTYFNGVRLEDVSVQDFQKYEDTEVNWRVAEGYGALVEAFAGDVAVTCSCPVLEINHGGRRIRVETALGTITADKVILTISSDVMASGTLRFTPEIPEKREAAADLPLGLVNKAFFHCDVPFPNDGHLFGNPQTVDTGSYHLRPFGRPMIEAFYAGQLAHDMARDGTSGAVHFGIEELAKLLGSDMRKALRPMAVSSWGADPFIRGSYSHAKVGFAGARAVLAADVNDRLFFAGEATSAEWFSTAHGAYMSGVHAALRLLGETADTGTLICEVRS